MNVKMYECVFSAYYQDLGVTQHAVRGVMTNEKFRHYIRKLIATKDDTRLCAEVIAYITGDENYQKTDTLFFIEDLYEIQHTSGNE